MYCKIYINVLVYLCLHKNYTQKLCYKKEISIQICKLGNAMNANEACQWMLAGYADPDASYPDADPDAT